MKILNASFLFLLVTLLVSQSSFAASESVAVFTCTSDDQKSVAILEFGNSVQSGIVLRRATWTKEFKKIVDFNSDIAADVKKSIAPYGKKNGSPTMIFAIHQGLGDLPKVLFQANELRDYATVSASEILGGKSFIISAFAFNIEKRLSASDLVLHCVKSGHRTF